MTVCCGEPQLQSTVDDETDPLEMFDRTLARWCNEHYVSHQSIIKLQETSICATVEFLYNVWFYCFCTGDAIKLAKFTYVDACRSGTVTG